MSLKDRVVETYQSNGKNSTVASFAANPGPANGSAVGDGAGDTVVDRHDRREFMRTVFVSTTTRSKHGVIPFDHIGTASLTTRSLAAEHEIDVPEVRTVKRGDQDRWSSRSALDTRTVRSTFE